MNQSKRLKEFNPIEEYIVYDSDKLRVVSDPTFSDIHILKIYVYDNNKTLYTTRISMEEPIYIDSEFDNHILTNDELNEFINCLKLSRINDQDCSIYSVWDMIIDKCNDCYKRSDINKRIPLDLPIPDYSILPTQS